VSKYDGTTWTTYTTTNSLASNNVYAIGIDSAGIKWFGTDNGVSKYDGTTWTTYSRADGLASNNVYAIGIDSAGIKWFGTDVGVSKYDGTTWTNWSTYSNAVNWWVASSVPS